MTTAGAQSADWRRPTRWAAMVFAAKVSVHRLRRLVSDIAGGGLKPHVQSAAALPVLLSESVTPLWGDPRPEERAYQAGKVENLRQAASRLDGLVIPAGEVFSFWRQVGRPGVDRGFVEGRMLQQGCLIPSPGGGLCQLSNALYQAARLSGCDVVERHTHTRAVPGSAAVFGDDATVAWNYVDLRLRPASRLRLEVKVDDERLSVRFTGEEGVFGGRAVSGMTPAFAPVARTCATCVETKCFRHQGEKAS